jgi:predicted ATPase with chaperone activity
MDGFKANAPRRVRRERVKEALGHLVVSERMLDQLGPAVNAGHSMFVHGPPGNGKTVISQAVQNLLDGDIHVPYALDVEGSIVRLHDPVMHQQVPYYAAAGLSSEQEIDRRWVRCRRPLVMTGGELTLDALELSYSPTSGFYKAPVQAVANGGLLVIDDFGRQRVKPRDLLNRWIVPLESGVDFLTLTSGQKFELPFMVLVVFATNIRPLELVDEAFLRRIQYKVFCASPTRDEFVEIFRRYCAYRDVQFDLRVVHDLLDNYYTPRQIQLRGCQPRDLIEHALALAEYHGDPPELTRSLLRAACDSYFVDDADMLPAPPTSHA